MKLNILALHSDKSNDSSPLSKTLNYLKQYHGTRVEKKNVKIVDNIFVHRILPSKIEENRSQSNI